MSWCVESDISKLLHQNESLLLSCEDKNNFLLQALTRTIQDSSSKNVGFSKSNEAIALLYDNTLLFSTFDSRALSGLPDLLVEHFGLENSRQEVRKVFGPEETVQNFTREWLQLHKNLRTEKQFATLLHKLQQLQPIQKSSGHFRRAWLEELNILAQWYKNFWEETGVGNDSSLTEAQITLQMINNKRLFVWGHHRAVAMASVSGSTPKGIRINCVYTPLEKRNQGYAKSIVSSLSEFQLSQGKEFVVLFTDVLQPQNAILYKKVGFEPITQFLNYSFSI